MGFWKGAKTRVNCENRNVDSFVPAVERAILIIDHVERHTGPVTLTQISTKLNLPKSSTSRILATLVRYDYLQQNSHGTFELGTRFLTLASSVKLKSNLIKIASPPMEALTDAIGETTKLSVRLDLDAMTLYKAQSSREMSINIEIGHRFPLYVGAAGKLLLAYSPAEIQKRVLQGPFRRLTSNTIVEVDLLKDSLAEILDLGYATDDEEFAEGIRALACPVFDLSEHVVAAVSIPFLATKANDHRKQCLLDHLQQTAATISRELGFAREWPLADSDLSS